MAQACRVRPSKTRTCSSFYAPPPRTGCVTYVSGIAARIRRAARPARPASVAPPASAARPPPLRARLRRAARIRRAAAAVRGLCLECSVRLPGHERTGKPVSNVVDLPYVVGRPPYAGAALPRRAKTPR